MSEFITIIIQVILFFALVLFVATGLDKIDQRVSAIENNIINIQTTTSDTNKIFNDAINMGKE